MTQYNRFMFFCQERGGGTLYDRLLQQRDDSMLKAHGVVAETVKLPTVEDVEYHPLYQNIPLLLQGGSGPYDKLCGYCMYADCWWGSGTVETFPEPIWGPTKLFTDFLGEGDWVVFSLLREGRSHVTSRVVGDYINTYNQTAEPEDRISKTRNTAVEYADHVNKALSEFDKFETHCWNWKHKTRKNIENNRQFSNYHILYFEDMVADPRGFLEDMLLKCGLTPQVNDTVSFKTNTTSIWGQGQKHLPSEQTNRYDIWQDRHFEICERVMGPELKEMGYTGRGVAK